MSAADILCYESDTALAEDVAQRLITVLTEVQATGRQPHVALTGGTIASQIYDVLGRIGPGSPVDWSNVAFWWGDERFVPSDSPERNALQARQAFLDVVGATRVHEMPTPNSACSVEEGARAYSAEIKASGAGHFDVVLLSLGPDGHVASIFPGSPQATDTDHIAVGVTNSPKPPAERITLTIDALNHADRIWLLAAGVGEGGSKEAAFREATAPEPPALAARLHAHLDTLWFTSP